MAPIGPDAANSCLPSTSPVIWSVPPVPSPERGERCPFDGKVGRLNSSKAIVSYTSGKLVIVRVLSLSTTHDNNNNDNIEDILPAVLPHSDSVCKLPVLVYRGHHYPVTAIKMSPSGAYMVSGDNRGMIKVWSFDHEEHLCKYDSIGLTGPIRDIDWDNESKRICIAGERNNADQRSDCAKAMQWDTGVTVGQLSQHIKGRVSTIAFKPNRPYRIVTGGRDDTRTYFHKGPPFTKIPSVDSIPIETAHSKGSVNCIRYNSTGSLAVSISTDRSICIYEGKDWKLLSRKEDIHDATIYSCSWTSDDKYIMTSSGDGTCKLFELVNSTDGATTTVNEIHKWTPALYQAGNNNNNNVSSSSFDNNKVPVGGVQLGCAFVNGNIPVSVGYNGQISIMSMPPKSAAGGGGSSSSSSSSSYPTKVITGHYAPMAGMTTIDYERNLFYTGDTDGIICQWDLKKCEPIRRLQHPLGNHDLMYTVHNGAISGLAILKGSGIMLSVGWDDKLYITDPPTTSSTASIVRSNPIVLGAQPSAISAGKEIAVIATVKGLLVVQQSDLQSVSDMISTSSYTPMAVCVSSDDKTVYVGGDDCKIHIYNVVSSSSSSLSLKEVHVIENGHLQPIHAFSISNDGTKLASADTRDVCVFDISTTMDYKPIISRGRWCFHVQRITCLCWSDDDQYIISGSADDSIYIWSIEKKMKRIHYPYAHRGGLISIQYIMKEEEQDGSSSSSSSKKKRFISVGTDSVVNLWDVTQDIHEKFK